jgi:ethanolamine utilization protein EutA
MASVVQLVGLDFGTTTCAAVVASARLLQNSVTGRMQLDEVCEICRSPMVFTPLTDGGIDLRHVEVLLETWLAEVRADQLFGGGALLTGLTAQANNRAVLIELIRRRLGNALIAVADDPCLESWLAFQGSCAALSRSMPDRFILNLDIGGGTTNLALGQAGEVLRTGCLFVGARHIQVEPGTHRLVCVSSFAQALLNRLGIDKGPGDMLMPKERDAILNYYAQLLERTIAGNHAVDAIDRLHTQVAFDAPRLASPPIVTLSGGVGELIYSAVRGQPWPATTSFGDLGIDLAQRLFEHPRWRGDFERYQPSGGGRATVYGLLRHSTEVSGATIYLARSELLPLPDVPIFGTVSLDTSVEQLAAMLRLVERSPRGGCLYVVLPDASAEAVRVLANRLADQLEKISLPAARPLVLVVHGNVGKALGQYVTRWGETPWAVAVIDEVPLRDAQYVHLGRLQHQVVPVSFFGLQP